MPRRGKMRVGNPAPDDGLGGLVKDGVKFTLGGFRKDRAQEDEPEGLEGLGLCGPQLDADADAEAFAAPPPAPTRDGWAPNEREQFEA